MKFVTLFIIFTFYSTINANQLIDGQYITVDDTNTIDQQHLTAAPGAGESTYSDYITTPVPVHDKPPYDFNETFQYNYSTPFQFDFNDTSRSYSSPSPYELNKTNRSYYSSPSPYEFNETYQFNYSTLAPFGFNETHRFNHSTPSPYGFNTTHQYNYSTPFSLNHNMTHGFNYSTPSPFRYNETHWFGKNDSLHHFGGFNSTNGTHSQFNQTFYNGTFSMPRNISYFHLNGTQFTKPNVNHTFANLNNFTHTNYLNGSRYNASYQLNSPNILNDSSSSPVLNEVKSLLSELRSMKFSLESKLNHLDALTNGTTEHHKSPHYHNEKETIKVTETKRKTERRGNTETIEDSETKQVINRENSWDE